MKYSRIAKKLALPAMMSVLIAGCAGELAQYPITAKKPAKEALITFEAPAFKNAKVVRVHHLDAFEHIEYARFETDDGLSMETVYDTSLGVDLVLDYNYWIEKMVDTWNVNRGQTKAFGERKSVQAWHGEIDYQPYRLGGNRQCIAFNSEWDHQARDPFGRPSRVLFGYVCAKPGDTLSEQRIAQALKGLQISKRNSESFVPVNSRLSVDQIALNTAKGTTGNPTGNTKFPFNFGTPYFEGEDRFN
jgi:hypothetical protein